MTELFVRRVNTFGLGQVLQAIPPIVIVIKAIGALYLSWLGVNLLRSWLKTRVNKVISSEDISLSPIQMVSRGFLNNIMNPKALLFFSLFLPQFVNDDYDLTTQFFILGALLSIIALVINITLSFWFSKLGSFIGSNFKIGHHVDGFLGVVFLGLAARLATSE
ncbi:LysE family translocator [Microbulbifer epialgicus]|uniref:LysE family translocator n=1 Tax=Microbulbifer epialgicus TaxID=393907 RepID=A0ABV4P5B6_9GAMM